MPEDKAGMLYNAAEIFSIYGISCWHVVYQADATHITMDNSDDH
jgi:hypothetical protein